MVAVLGHVRVRMDHGSVLVEVLVDQVGADQQVAVGQDGRGRTVGHDATLLTQYHHAVGDQRHDVQLMSGGDQGPAGRTQPLNEIHHCLLYTSDAADDLLCVD